MKPEQLKNELGYEQGGNIVRIIRQELFRLVLALSIFSLFVFLLLFVLSFLLSGAPLAKADNPSEVEIKVGITPSVSLSLTNCAGAPDPDNSSLTLPVTPIPSGRFASNCQVLGVATNTPGYTLTAKATGGDPNLNAGATTNALIFQDTLPSGVTTPYTITATTNPMSAPAALDDPSDNNTWGFAVSGNNVDLSSSPAA
ncbi:MAG: hypothetical protein LBU20_00120, partial [Candidatus Nomurabacteria bacterium]|nr:hypothetical protein [Candidatus Nomurabacteria bacterium]